VEPLRLQSAAYALPYERVKPATVEGLSVEQSVKRSARNLCAVVIMLTSDCSLK
jgi:hypothetical protein